MSQIVDVIELLKVQTINEFEIVVKLLLKGYIDLNLNSILDKISFIEEHECIGNVVKIGERLADLSNLSLMLQLQEYQN